LFAVVAAGAPIDLEILFPGHYPLRPLPAYPWQKQSYWQNATPDGYQLAKRLREHPLLGYRLKDAPRTWENPANKALRRFMALS
jgi:acyl transferase domain-containing protein